MRSHMEDALLTKMHAGRGILVGYLPLGDPAMGDLVSRAGSFLEAGVDVLELGVPCERPVLDGAVVRGSMQRALERTSAECALASVARLASAYPGSCLQVMTYFEVIARMGVERFAEACAQSGVGGVLSPDAPSGEVPALDAALECRGVLSLRFAPYRLGDEDAKRLAREARGYVFLQSVDGKTGPQRGVSPRVRENVGRLRDAGVAAPVCAGFGVSSPEQVAELSAMGADGVIVGSSIIESVLAGRSTEYIRSLRRALG